MALTNSSFGGEADIKLTVGGQKKYESTDEDINITNFMVDTSVWGEAGICEVEFTLLTTSGNADLESAYLNIAPDKKLEISVKKPGGAYKKIFTGFVEKIEVDISSQNSGETMTGNNNLKFIVYGMDAKLRMMTNIQTQQHNDPKNNKNFSKIIKEALDKHKSSCGIASTKVSLSKDFKVKSALCQVNESDYDFFRKVADSSGSVFFISSDNEAKFGDLTKLSGSKTIAFSGDVSKGDMSEVISLNYSASVYGVPTSVTVEGANETAPSNEKSKIISASAKGSSIDKFNTGKGKSMNTVISRNAKTSIAISVNSVKEKQEMECRVNAICTKRISNAVKVQVVTRGRSDVNLGDKIKLENYGKPINGQYIVTRIVHYCGSAVQNSYTTTFELSASKIDI